MCVKPSPCRVLKVSFTAVAANDRAGTVAATNVVMVADAVHVVAAVAPPAAAAVAVAAVLAAVDAAVVALLVDVVLALLVVLGSDIEKSVRRPTYHLYWFLQYSAPQVSFASTWALLFKLREGDREGKGAPLFDLLRTLFIVRFWAGPGATTIIDIDERLAILIVVIISIILILIDLISEYFRSHI